MRDNPLIILLGVSVLLWLGGQTWRRRTLKRAVRDLPTLTRRQLGPEPSFDPPAETPDGLAPYAALHARTRKVELAVRAVALAWLVYVLYLATKGTLQ
ncbi:MAG: hypothetical protein QNJ09_16550 [Paracoccaceae bacterium]|nr:hypothetical protein [Paracoccaceae bacterium]